MDSLPCPKHSRTTTPACGEWSPRCRRRPLGCARSSTTLDTSYSRTCWCGNWIWRLDEPGKRHKSTHRGGTISRRSSSTQVTGRMGRRTKCRSGMRNSIASWLSSSNAYSWWSGAVFGINPERRKPPLQSSLLLPLLPTPRPLPRK